MAPYSSTLAWKIPWMEEPGRLQSMGSLRVRHDWATSLSLFTFMHWRRKWQPTPVFLPGESQGPGAWWATIYGVAQSQTRLKLAAAVATSEIKFVFLPLICLYACLIIRPAKEPRRKKKGKFLPLHHEVLLQGQCCSSGATSPGLCSSPQLLTLLGHGMWLPCKHHSCHHLCRVTDVRVIPCFPALLL